MDTSQISDLAPVMPPRSPTKSRSIRHTSSREAPSKYSRRNEGGKQTGQRVTHYIEHGGPFEEACRELIENGHEIRYVELSDPTVRKKKAESKSKYTCDQCDQNAWGKPDLKLRCDHCDVPMRIIG
jgi:hypothetical protein